MANPYDNAHGQLIKDPDGIWGRIVEDYHWTKKWDNVLDNSCKSFSWWFTGSELNKGYNALDLHFDKDRGDGQTASIKTPTVVKRLPKTRSTKMLRSTIQKITDNKDWKMPATIDDPVILDAISQALKTVKNTQERKA